MDNLRSLPYLFANYFDCFRAIVYNVCVIAVVENWLRLVLKEIMRKETPTMSDLWSNPLFGLALSILAYLCGLLIFFEISSSFDNTVADCSSFGYCFLKLTGISTRITMSAAPI